jgi:hypothetical protein
MDDFLKKFKEIHGEQVAPTSRLGKGKDLNPMDDEEAMTAASNEHQPSPDNLVDQWKAAGRKTKYLSKYRIYQLVEGGNYQVDFGFNGRRVRKTLATTDREEAARRAVELIRAHYKAKSCILPIIHKKWRYK